TGSNRRGSSTRSTTAATWSRARSELRAWPTASGSRWVRRHSWDGSATRSRQCLSPRPMAAEGQIRALGMRTARRVLRGSLPSDIVAELIENKVGTEPQLQNLYEEMSDEQARLHFGAEEPLESEHLRRSVRYF